MWSVNKVGKRMTSVTKESADVRGHDAGGRAEPKLEGNY
jgi:hypothetical protein